MLQRLRRWCVARVPPAAHPALSAIFHGETTTQRTLSQRLAAIRTTRDRRRLTDPGQSDPGRSLGQVRAVMTKDGPRLATTVDRFCASQVLDDNLALVVDALEGAEVPYAVLEAGVMRRRVVIVTGERGGRGDQGGDRDDQGERSEGGDQGGDRDDQGERARRAIRQRYQGDSVHVTAVAPGVLRVFRVLTAGDVVLASDDLGCDLEIWPLVEADAVPRPDGSTYVVGTALAPRPNRRAAYLTPDRRRPTAVVVGSRSVTTYPGLLAPHVFDVGFPVDVVYTWVDGSDPAWVARKDAALARSNGSTGTGATGGVAGDRHEFAANEARYVSHDELRYSLRSLEMYADWVRNVYIVTDDQTPAWLNLDHPKVHLVSHRELFGQSGGLPSFNSHAIESRLHHIPGLAEHYLYLNDDVLFGRPVAPELFFHGNGLAKFFLSARVVDLDGPSARDLPVVSATKNNRALIEQAFEATITHRFQHVTHPLRRSVMAELEERFPDELARTAASPFRSPQDLSVSASLAHYYGYMMGKAIPDTLDYRYCDISEPKAQIKLQRLLRGRDADVFCINEVDTSAEDSATAQRLVEAFLGAYFPVSSDFENVADRPGPRPREGFRWLH